MPEVHRDTDQRICGHTTIVVGQSTVYANSLLISVDGDPNNWGGGDLIAGCDNVFIGGILVVNHSPDQAAPDFCCPPAPHCNPMTAEGSPDVFIGD